MLYVVAEYGVKDPVEAQKRIDNHGKVIYPRLLVAKNIAEERVASVRIAQACRRNHSEQSSIFGVIMKVDLLQSIAMSQMAANSGQVSLQRRSRRRGGQPGNSQQ